MLGPTDIRDLKIIAREYKNYSKAELIAENYLEMQLRRVYDIVLGSDICTTETKSQINNEVGKLNKKTGDWWIENREELTQIAKKILDESD